MTTQELQTLVRGARVLTDEAQRRREVEDHGATVLMVVVGNALSTAVEYLTAEQQDAWEGL